MFQTPIYIAAALAVIVLFVFFIRYKTHASPYKSQSRLITKAEQNFYRQLIRAIDGRCIVFSMVRIADVIEVNDQIKGNKRRQHFYKISSKHFDFVLVDDDMRILCAIELNDSSHERKDRQERDKFVRKAMKSAKLPLLEIKAARKYDIKVLRLLLSEYISVQAKEVTKQASTVPSYHSIPAIPSEVNFDNVTDPYKNNAPAKTSLEEDGHKTLAQLQAAMEVRDQLLTPFELAQIKAEAYLRDSQTHTNDLNKAQTG